MSQGGHSGAFAAGPSTLCRAHGYLAPSLILVALLFITACGSGGPTEVADEATEQATSASPANQDDRAHLRVVGRAMQEIRDITVLLNQVALGLASQPDAAPRSQEVVATAKETLEALRVELLRTPFPDQDAAVQQQLVEALDFYVRAADALLPDPETNEADDWRFHDLMGEAGKRFHGAGEALGGTP